jgi:lipoprotein-anchoring transpeptidase ErfK/SrfK
LDKFRYNDATLLDDMMMKYINAAILILSILLLPVSQAAGQAKPVSEGDQAAQYYNLPLCLPGMVNDGTCLFLGPAQTVHEMREAGFPYPPMDLPAAEPSPALNIMPVSVARINLDEDDPAPIYGSFADAVAGTNPISQIAQGEMRWVSYVNLMYDDNNKAYVQLSSGGWLRASPAAIPDFQGLVFFETPRNDFGWVVDQTPTYQAPSFSAAVSIEPYYREDVFQVFNQVEAEGVTWYQVAPEAWLNSMKFRVVNVNPTRPEGVETDRWIEINLLQQTLSVYEDGQLIFATLIASGVENFYTQPGVFQIYEKKPLELMQGAFEADRSDFYFLQDVPWTMYFDQARALHAAYWRTFFGYPQSHGCVNLSPGDAKWLFEWADVGETVWVHDPSGRTPTDAEYYGPGAP